MPQPVSQRVRDQIVDACDRGEPRSLIIRKYAVSGSFIRRLLQRRRETGEYGVRPRSGGRKPAIAGNDLAKLTSLVKRYPDASISELQKQVGRGSSASICRALTKAGLVMRRGRYKQTERGAFRSAATDPVFTTALGRLYEADCTHLLPLLPAESVDVVFADPPFNLGKKYGRKVRDRRPDDVYREWCRTWLRECVRMLKPGGTLFAYHIPRWGVQLGSILMDLGMTLRHWIAIDIRTGLTIRDRLAPRHYCLLYFTKGRRPKTFHVLRQPPKACRHCGRELGDYGGHRDQLHPEGVRISDIWYDINGVNHYRHKHRSANQLPEKMVTRCIELSTDPGDLVLDIFSGAGTVPAICERLARRWLAIEIESVEGIIERLSTIS